MYKLADYVPDARQDIEKETRLASDAENKKLFFFPSRLAKSTPSKQFELATRHRNAKIAKATEHLTKANRRARFVDLAVKKMKGQGVKVPASW